LLEDFVALAGEAVELLAVDKRDCAAGAGDSTVALEGCEGDADGRAVGADHAGEEVVGGGDDVGVEAVERGQEPSGQSLFDVVEAVAGSVLRHLHGADREAVGEDTMQFG